MAAGAISVVLFGVGWFVGVLGNVAVAFDAPALHRATEAFRFLLPTDGLWRGVIYGLEPPLVLLMSVGRTRRGEPVLRARRRRPLAFTAWSVVWVLLVLAAGHRAVPAPRALTGAAAQEPASAFVSNRFDWSGSVAGRPAGVVDGPEHVRGDGLRARGAVQRDPVQAARDPALRQVELRQVADVRPRVALEHRAQLRRG